MNMDYGWLETLIMDSPEQSRDFYIVNGDKQIVFSFNKELLNTSLDDQEYNFEMLENKGSYIDKQKGVIIGAANSSKSEWRYIYVTDVSEYFAQMDRYSWYMILMFCFIMILCIFISYFISVQVFLPVKQIVQMIDNPCEFYELNSQKQQEDRNKDELKYITSSFIKTISEQERYKEELKKYVTKYTETQISLLQSQINPHFLCNTLQTISFLSLELLDGENIISDTIDDLSVMLREIMNIDTNLISIEDEIKYTKAYIEILEKRYDGKLKVRWNCPEELLKHRTLKFILQPAVENSVKHGYKNMKTPGEIRITIEKSGDDVCYSVSDDGIGADSAWVEKMNQELSKGSLIGNHVGLRNVNQRIKLLFGESYGVKICDCSAGFSVVIKIPNVI